MGPNHLKAIATIGFFLTIIIGIIYYFSHTFSGSEQSVEKAVASFVLKPPPPTWRQDQLQVPNVRIAVEESEPALKTRFKEAGLEYPPKQVLLRGIQDEGVLEVWIGKSPELPFHQVKSYPYCTDVSQMGELLKKTADPSTAKTPDDAPIPVGFYRIETFYPRDHTYFLALQLNYPNTVDQARKKTRGKPPKAYIRGGCGLNRSINLGYEGIQEVYLMAMEARAAGQEEIPVYLFPTRMTDEVMAPLKKDARGNRSTLRLYDRLKTGYDRFEETHRPLNVVPGEDGDYLFDVQAVEGDSSQDAPHP